MINIPLPVSTARHVAFALVLAASLFVTRLGWSQTPPRPCTTNPPPGIASISYDSPTHFTVRAAPDHRLEVRGAAQAVLGVVEAGQPVVGFAFPPAVDTVTIVDTTVTPATSCTVGLAEVARGSSRHTEDRRFAIDRERAVITAAAIRSALGIPPESTATAYRLVVGLAVATGGASPRPAAGGSCPTQGAEVAVLAPWDGRDVHIPVARVQGANSTLQLSVQVQSEQATECARVAQFRRDSRVIEVQAGLVRHITPVAELSAGLALETPVPESAADGECSIVVRDGATEVARHGCDGERTIPASGDLPELVFRHRRVAFAVRVAGNLNAGECPVDRGSADAEIRHIGGGHGPRRPIVCLYSRGTGASDWHLVDAPPVGPQSSASLLSLRFSLCWNGAPAQDATCSSPTPLGARLSAAPDASASPVWIRVSVANDEPRLQFVRAVQTRLGSFRALPGPLHAASATTVSYVSAAVLDIPAALVRALCLPAPFVTPGVAALESAYVQLALNNREVPVPAGWVANGTLICPHPQATDSLAAAAREALSSGTDLVVEYRQLGALVGSFRLTRRLDVAHVYLFDRPEPRPNDQPMSGFTPAGEPFRFARALCVEVNTVGIAGGGQAISLDLSTLDVRDQLGRRIGAFASTSGTTHSFSRVQSSGAVSASAPTSLYCTAIDAETTGPSAVRFAADPAVGIEFYRVSFAVNGDVHGCVNETGGRQPCGSLEPQAFHSAAGGGAITFSHVDVGVWSGLSTTAPASGDRTRLRIAANMPLAVVTMGHPRFVFVDFETGVSIPVSLTGDVTPPPTGGMVDRSSVMGFGVAAYASVCLTVRLAIVPRLCFGGMADAGFDFVQSNSRVVSLHPQGGLSWMATIGAGLH